MVTKYKACFFYDARIEKVEVERETECSVYTEGRREAKESATHRYFDTFQEAKTFLLDVFEQSVQSARLDLERANGRLENVKGMKEF